LKYNGRPFYTSDIVGGVRRLMANGMRVVRVGDKAPDVMLEAVPEGD
jgi:hypothetical protein